MREMTAPNIVPAAVYQECINSISDVLLRNSLNAVAQEVENASNEYQQKAPLAQLFTMMPNHGDNNLIDVGNVTKKQLKDVYEAHMVPRSKPARKYYDDLMAEAPLGRCPFCGFGHASTLDHYLPKSKYPKLSVLPHNLVPCCKDCNSGKLADIATTAEEQSLHPYYDHAHFINEQWLFAHVVQSTPVTVQYYVQAPEHWSTTSKARVQYHFNEFKLASRYAIEASTQLASLRDTLAAYRELSGVAAVKQHLFIEANTHFQQHNNSWQTALFQSLANSDWYCDGGFL